MMDNDAVPRMLNNQVLINWTSAIFSRGMLFTVNPTIPDAAISLLFVSQYF
jgi:hypothetical protein